MKPVNDLDSAIDLVAKQLTHVDDDPVLASRIIASLPERQTWFGWLFTSWALRLAVFAVAAVASLLVIDRRPQPSGVDVLSSRPSVIVAAAIRPNVKPEPLEPLLRTRPLELLEPLEPLEPGKADHEFSLPALDVEALPPMNLPAVASIELSPLTIVDLPLTSEFPERY